MTRLLVGVVGPALFVCLSLGSGLAAQIPAGSYVTSHFKVGTFIFPAGLFNVGRSGGVTQIANVPPEVAGVGATIGGPDFVVHRSDGVLVTDGTATVAQQLPVFFLTLQGLSVSSAVRYDVGQVTSGSSRGIPQAHALSNGAVAIAVDDQTVGVAGEPLAGALLGIVDPNVGPPGTPGSVAAVPISPRPAGAINALAVDEALGVAYLGMTNAPSPSVVWSVPFPGGGAPTQVASLAPTITGLAVDNRGLVLATATGSGGLHRIDPATGNVTRIAPTLTNLNGVAVERATGLYVVMTGAPGSRVLRIAGLKGTPQQITTGPGTGWGTGDGIAIANSPIAYGAGTPGLNTYDWALTPNPGGLPLVGNNRFSVTVRSTPGVPLASALVMTTGAQTSPLPVLGVQLWVNVLTGLVATFPAPGASSTAFPIPIPNRPAFRGLELFLQSVHVESTGAFASARAVHMTVL